MRKLLLTFFLACFALPALAQSGTKISQMPSGGAILNTDAVPFIRGGVNFKGTIAALAGSSGDVQTNNGAGGFGSFSLNTTAGTGNAGQGLLLNNGGVTQALSIGTVNSLPNVISPPSTAANALYQASQALQIDPRGPLFGAVCNAQYADGRSGNLGLVTMNSTTPVISIAGYTFKTSDIGKFISINGGAPDFISQPNLADPGIGTTTIISIGPGGATATIGAQPTINSSIGYAVFGNDDTSAFHAASIQAALMGGAVIVPDDCLVRELTLANGTALKGSAVANGYPYDPHKPVMYILSTGYSHDSTNYGINVSGSDAIGLEGFEIRGNVFPGFGFYTGANLSCVGTTTGNAATGDALVLQSMTLGYCFVGLGPAETKTQSGYLFGKSHFTEYASNGWGMYGDISDWESTGDVFSGNFIGGMSIGPNGSGNGANAGRINGVRFEETGIGVECNNCVGLTLTGDEWQFNDTYDVVLAGNWGLINITGGNMVNAFANLSAPHRAHINIAGNSGSGVLRVNGMAFVPFGENYIIDATSSASNTTVAIEGGYAAPAIGNANWEVAPPARFKYDVFSQPTYISGVTDFTINASHALGLQTSNAQPGMIFDALNASTSNNSSIGLPNGTLANRPGTPVPGMLRYNTTTPGVEAFVGNSWSNLGAPALPAYIGGLSLSNDATTPNTVIDISPGGAASDDGATTMLLTAGATKTTGAWAVGTGNGCLDTGSVASSTWYHVFAIQRLDTQVVDFLCSTSTAPLMPTAYTEKRLIGDIKTDSSAHILSFLQLGNIIQWGTPTLDINAGLPDASAHLETLNVPPGESVLPIGNYTVAGAGNAILWSSPSAADLAPTTTNPFTGAPGFSALANSTTTGIINTNLPSLITNTSGQIRVRATAATTTVAENTFGWTNPFIPSSSCNYSPPLDSLSASAAYSFRALSTKMVGKNIVRLSRSSDGSTKDFQVFFPTCTINQADPFFDGSASYNVVIWYDQSGNAPNATQATTSKQPTFTLSCQNSQPCAVFTGSNQTGFSVTVPTANSSVTFAAVAKTATSSGALAAATGGGFVSVYDLRYNGSTICQAQSIWSGGGAATAGNKTCATNTEYAWIGTMTSSLASIYLNGSIGTDSTVTSAVGNGSTFYIGEDFNLISPIFWTGNISEEIFYAPSLTITNSNAVTANQRAFWGL